MKFVPATTALLDAFYQDEAGRPTLRGYVVLDGDVPKAVGGFVRLAQNAMLVFSDSKEEDRQKHKVTTLRFAKYLIGIARQNGWTLYALPEDNIDEAVKTLKHLGFKEQDDGYYVL